MVEWLILSPSDQAMLRLLKKCSDCGQLGGITFLKDILTPGTLGTVPRDSEKLPMVI